MRYSIKIALLFACVWVGCRSEKVGKSPSVATVPDAHEDAGYDAGEDAGETKKTVATATRLVANLGTATKVGRYALVATGARRTVTQRLKRLMSELSPDASVDESDGIASGELVKIDEQGNVTKVFNVAVSIADVQTTPNYVIVDGVFPNVIGSDGADASADPSTDASTEIDGATSDEANRCYLLAIKKSDSALHCISRTPVGTYDYTQGSLHVLLQTYNTDFNTPCELVGYTVRGSTVYFIDNSTDTLFSWDEGSSENTAVLRETPEQSIRGNAVERCFAAGMTNVFVDRSSPTATAICVLNPYSRLSTSVQDVYNFTPGNVLCAADGHNFNPVIVGGETYDGKAINSVSVGAMQLGSALVTDNVTVDLKTLTVTQRGDSWGWGGLPGRNNANVAHDSSGGLVGVGVYQHLIAIDAHGRLTYPDNLSTGATNTPGSEAEAGVSPLNYYQQLLSVGKYAWATSDTERLTDDITDPHSPSSRLARYDLKTGTLDATNYFSASGMIRINSMTYDPSGSIRLDGLDEAGNPAVALINADGNITSVTKDATALDKLWSL